MNVFNCLLRGVCVAGLAFGAGSPARGDGGRDFEDLLEWLSDVSHERREQTLRALSERLSDHERSGRRKELSIEMDRLRRMAADANLPEDTRAQAARALAPFLAGSLRWEEGMPGSVRFVRLMEDLFFACGGCANVNRNALGWAGVYNLRTGTSVWEIGSDVVGSITRFAEVLPEGILIGGENNSETREAAGWVALLDAKRGKPVWSSDRFPSGCAKARLIQGVVAVGGEEPGQPPGVYASWLAALSLADGKKTWEKREIPGRLGSLQATHKGILAGGFRPPDKGVGEDKAKEGDIEKVKIIGGRYGWLACFSEKDGKLIWDRRDVPGVVSDIQATSWGILAKGSRHHGYMTPETQKRDQGGLVKGRWIGMFDGRDGHPLWSHAWESGGGLGRPVQVIPIEIIRNRVFAASVMGDGRRIDSQEPFWVKIYLDAEGSPLEKIFEPKAEEVHSMAEGPSGAVFVGGGSSDDQAWWVRRCEPDPSIKGKLKSRWETPTPGPPCWLVSEGGILIAGSGGGADEFQSGITWLSALDVGSGNLLWSIRLPWERGVRQMEARAVTPEGVLVGGGMQSGEGEGWARLYRLRDADAAPCSVGTVGQ